MDDQAQIPHIQSRWLREAKAAILLRDPVDALNDAEALVRFAQARLDAIFGENAVIPSQAVK